MNAMKNRVQLIGHVGDDPEIKTLKVERVLANLTIATNDSYKKMEGEKSKGKQGGTKWWPGENCRIIENT
jgi:single-strand DNA-binding protein